MLDVVEEKLPIGSDEWDIVAEFHNQRSGKNRTADSLKKKFTRMKRSKVCCLLITDHFTDCFSRCPQETLTCLLKFVVLSLSSTKLRPESTWMTTMPTRDSTAKTNTICPQIQRSPPTRDSYQGDWTFSVLFEQLQIFHFLLSPSSCRPRFRNVKSWIAGTTNKQKYYRPDLFKVGDQLPRQRQLVAMVLLPTPCFCKRTF
jgi:hypothetical protein